MPRRLSIPGLLLALLALVAGCTSTEVADPARAPELASIGRRPALPLRLLVAPIADARAATAAAATASAAPAEALASAPVPQVDLGALGHEVCAAMDAARVCSMTACAPASLTAHAKLLESAYDQGFDLLLELRLTRYQVSYLGDAAHSGLHYLAIFAMTQLVFPSWWVADETFACDYELEATLTAVGSERPLFARRSLRGREVATLDEFERGLTLTGPLFVESSLDDGNWLKVAQVVGPPARAAALVEVAKAVKALDPRAPELVTAHAVLVGAGHFGARSIDRGIAQAEDDAEALHAMLIESGVMPRKNAALVLRARATRAEILAALATAARRARPRDLIVFGFAGLGASLAGEPVLLPFDFDPARPRESGLRVADVAAALDANPARQALILDASFAPDERRWCRSFALTAAGASAPPPADAGFAPLARPGRAIVLSAGPAGQAWTTERRLGNFTGFLRSDATDPEAPALADGTVTLNALFDRVRRDVRSAFDPPQEAAWLGDAAGVVVPIYRRGAGKAGAGASGESK